ncbi:conserved hypothetical protein [Perkinsus marinus ATCC 50983]|uniref:Ubiquitin carboxyl-terminal hydrolase n=1 Tax=Perkinsus marinus (strain ATCC 50983 / TXsc) TaxID=423536 RepID=C5KBB4_PERM5|nr:conserved hypothetical protein [Perkinsus marinus ATCC 50983]EER18440.1 conserved hypothetical protein [Perkinsus marinus ATCC 50983]|eukprot:XP_002786644.1 conserved hypothetical protein [Perkinsus marinus ATCC 50983]
MSDNKTSKKRWLPLEANPEVMTDYARSLGLPSFLHFTDVLSVEDWALEMVPQPVLAAVLLFPIKDSTEADDQRRIQAVKKEEIPASAYFTKQTVGNACGTIGIIHCMANIEGQCGVEYKEGSYINSLMRSTKSMSPDERAVYIEKDDKLEKAHREAENQGQSRPPAEDESVTTHFVAFTVVEGELLEFDGRKTTPIPHGKCPADQVLQRTVEVVKNVFMSRDPDEIRFNILALTAGEACL